MSNWKARNININGTWTVGPSTLNWLNWRNLVYGL